MQNGTPQSKPRLSGARVSGHAAKPQSIVSTWALAGESCGGRQERYSHKDEDPFHGGLQCCPNLAQHRLNDWQHEMVLAENVRVRRRSRSHYWTRGTTSVAIFVHSSFFSRERSGLRHNSERPWDSRAAGPISRDTPPAKGHSEPEGGASVI